LAAQAGSDVVDVGFDFAGGFSIAFKQLQKTTFISSNSRRCGNVENVESSLLLMNLSAKSARKTCLAGIPFCVQNYLPPEK
jgi:hypothetical protein